MSEQRQVACSLIVKDGLVLAVWNKKYVGWCLPGGKVEPSEDVDQAQERELLEETGLTTKRMRFIYSAPGCAEPDVLVHVYEVDAEGEPREMEEGCAVKWLYVRDLTESKPFGPFYKDMFEKTYPHYLWPMGKKVSGLKHDGADGKHERKPRWGLLPFDALREVVRVLTKGAEKYTAGGWIHVENAKERHTDALLRHVAAYAEGEVRDPEWNFHTLSHACCCALFLIAIDLRADVVPPEPPKS